MYRRLSALVSAICLLTVIFAISAYADGYDKGGQHGSSIKKKFFKKIGLVCRNQEELGISDDQFDQIKDLKIATKKSIIKKKAMVDITSVDIKTALWNEPVDTEAVTELIKKKYGFKVQRELVLLKAYVALDNMLTQEQKDTLKGLCKTRKK